MSKSYGNERDLEISRTLQFIKDHKDIKTTLDVGSHWTWNSYAQEVKDLVDKAYGVDIADDPQTSAILDQNFIGNVTDKSLKIPKVDFVFSISSIEHSGLSTYKADWEKERVAVFKRMYDLANKYLLVTCPFGTSMVIEGQYANITEKHLKQFSEAIGQELDVMFYFTPAQMSEFNVISPSEAATIDFDPAIGIPRCIAIIKVEKHV